MALAHSGEHFKTLPNPPVAGGRRPKFHCRRTLIRTNGVAEEANGAFYMLKKGETLACYSTGGCGVGNPLERDIESVRQDTLNQIISNDDAEAIYGVVLHPKTFEIDKTATSELRTNKNKSKTITKRTKRR